jgi:hypothetical protein
MAKLVDLIAKFPNRDWNWKALTDSTGVPIEFIMENHKLPWNWKSASQHVSFKFVQMHPKLDWDWDYLSQNVPLDNIFSNLSLPWNWKYISKHDDLTCDIVLENPDKPWDFSAFCTDESFLGQEFEEVVDDADTEDEDTEEDDDE